jgi:hypothetical protein
LTHFFVTLYTYLPVSIQFANMICRSLWRPWWRRIARCKNTLPRRLRRSGYSASTQCSVFLIFMLCLFLLHAQCLNIIRAYSTKLGGSVLFVAEAVNQSTNAKTILGCLGVKIQLTNTYSSEAVSKDNNAESPWFMAELSHFCVQSSSRCNGVGGALLKEVGSSKLPYSLKNVY